MRSFIVLFLLIALSAPAQLFSPFARLRLSESSHRSAVSSHRSVVSEQRYVSAILEVDDENAVERLEQSGVVIFHRRDNLLLACIPQDLLGSLDNLGGIRRAHLSRPLALSLDVARPIGNVDIVRSGSQDFPPLTGEGVIVGFSDIGFDPTHGAFAGRVAMLSRYVDTTALAEHFLAPDPFDDFITDNPDEYHATHVAGILAAGDAVAPYHGVAPHATIAAATSILQDVGILAGIEDIIAFAKDQNTSAVINLSIGSSLGPHDGSDAFCRYLDLCAQDAVIVLSAGNGGTSRASLSLDFDTDHPSYLVAVSDKINWDYNTIAGYTDIWSDDDTPVSSRFHVYDTVDARFVYSSSLISPDNPDDIWQAASTDNPDLARAFTGSLLAASEVNDDNNRFNLTLAYDLKCTEHHPDGSWARYYLLIEIIGNAGTHVYVNADDNTSAFQRPGYLNAICLDGTNDFSISDLTCGYNTISVGSYTSRDCAPLLSGSSQSWLGFVTASSISSFSAYGTLLDGRTLPHICAPGAFLISALSRPYIDAHPDISGEIAAQVGNDAFIAACGTSMSSPYAAGVFALWLQADPTLSPDEIRQIAIQSASTDNVDMSDPRAGAGLIDALAGLRIIINGAGIADLTDDTPPTIRRSGNALLVNFISEIPCSIAAFDLQGRPVSTSDLPPYPIIVKIVTPRHTFTRLI